MGVQSNEVNSFYTKREDSLKYLKGHANSEYLSTYYLLEDCFKKDEDKLKHSYLMSKYFSDDSCSIVDYVNRKLSGELDAEYRRRKSLYKIERFEFSWECNDMYDDTSCCEWKAIEW